MFTVIVGFDGSGKSSTLRPLGRRYSVIPSTVVTFTGLPATLVPGSCGGTRRCSALGFGVTLAMGAWANAMAGTMAQAANRRASREVIGDLLYRKKGDCRRTPGGALSPCIAPPPGLVEADTACHRHVQALDRSHHRDRHQQVAALAREAAQALAF